MSRCRRTLSGDCLRDCAKALDNTTNNATPTARLRTIESLYVDPTMDPAPPLPSRTSVSRKRPAKARAKRKAPARATFVTTWNPKPYAGVAFTSGSRPAGIHMNAPSTPAPRAAGGARQSEQPKPTPDGGPGPPRDV